MNQHASPETPRVRLRKPIFVSYRRDDTSGSSGRLFDALEERYGEDAIFFDVYKLDGGVDFVLEIEAALAKSGVLLAVIGPDWLRRAHDAGVDYVLTEVTAAFDHKVPVLPVLVEGGAVPPAESLPEPARALATLHALEISHSRWDHDLDRLVKRIEALVGITDAVTVLPPPKKKGCTVQVSVVVALSLTAITLPFLMVPAVDAPGDAPGAVVADSSGPIRPASGSAPMIPPSEDFPRDPSYDQMPRPPYGKIDTVAIVPDTVFADTASFPDTIAADSVAPDTALSPTSP